MHPQSVSISTTGGLASKLAVPTRIHAVVNSATHKVHQHSVRI